MEQETTSQFIAPKKVSKGENAWEATKYSIPFISKRPLLLGRSNYTLNIRNKIKFDLESLNLKVLHEKLTFDCCDLDLERIEYISKESSCDSIIATGGGKVLDAGKLIADRLNIPCITIPLSAATCAGWTALSNIYSPQGAFIKDIALKNCPDLLILDHNFIKLAPSNTLASGIADALAKWYESSISCGSSNDGMVQQAVQLSRVLRDQLLLNGYESYLDNKNSNWESTVEGCALSAGLIGGIGGAKCRTAAAHAVHNGLTQLKGTKKTLHGEIVGFGIFVQLKLEELFLNSQLAQQKRHQLRGLLHQLKIPLTLDDLGFANSSEDELKEACIFACKKGVGMENLPFNVTSEILLKAIKQASNEESIFKKKSSKSIIGNQN